MRSDGVTCTLGAQLVEDLGFGFGKLKEKYIKKL